MLTEKDVIFQRGDDGELIAQAVALENIEGSPMIKIKPLSRGKLQEIYAKATSGNQEEKMQADNDVIRYGLVEPKLSEESLKDLMPNFAGAITIAIMAISLGITQAEVGEKTKEALENQELGLKKN